MRSLRIGAFVFAFVAASCGNATTPLTSTADPPAPTNTFAAAATTTTTAPTDSTRFEPVMVEALILGEDVPAGTPGEAIIGVLRIELIPANLKPDAAIDDPDEIRGKVAVSALAANQILVPGMFVDAPPE